MATLFERLAQGRPPQEPTPPPGMPAGQELLNWIQRVWTQPTLRARDIYRYGPNAIRDKESALKSAKKLVERGWLAPIETRRHDMRKWRIMKGFD
jgi:hypothetical protein